MADYPIITDVTYAELLAMIGGSTLEPGCSYLITDFATVHWMVDSDNAYILTDDSIPEKSIVTGATEPLLVTATSTNTIAKEVHSTTYPDDIIHYEHDIASLNTLKQFYDSDLTETVTGFKGAITWRNDTKNNLQMSWDWRNIKHRFWNIKQPAWEAQGYAQNVLVTDNSMIYWAKLSVADVAEVYTVTLTGTNGTASITGIGGLTKTVTFATGGTQDLTQTAADFVTSFAEDYAESGVGVIVTSNGADLIFTSDTAGVGIVSPVITPSGESDDDLDGTVVHTTANYSVATEPKDDTSGRWINLQITADQYICYSAGGYYNWQFAGSIPIADLQDYIDVSPFGADCNNIVLEQNIRFDYVTFGSGCNSMTFGSNCGNMTFGSSCYSMTFGSNCGNMTFGSGCNSMTFGSNCGNMTFGSSCYSMTFGSNCGNMTFGSSCFGMTFGSNCYSMTFRSNCYRMTFGSSCANMTFGSSCANMTFGSSCYSMTFGSNCYVMTFGSSCYTMTFPQYTAFNDFKDYVGGVDFTGVGITQITTGITVTHQRANNGSAEIVQSYLNWVTDHYDMVYSTNKIGIFQD